MLDLYPGLPGPGPVPPGPLRPHHRCVLVCAEDALDLVQVQEVQEVEGQDGEVRTATAISRSLERRAALASATPERPSRGRMRVGIVYVEIELLDHAGPGPGVLGRNMGHNDVVTARHC